MIILKRMTWDDCFSYGTYNVLDFTLSNVTQLVGTNGAGKSSIPLILEEVLYNKNSKGIKKTDIANRHTEGSYVITLEFSVNDVDYIIKVKRGKNIKVSFMTADGEDLTSHTATNTYKTIETIIGLDFKTFSQLVYQSTTSSLQFLSATDTTRKKFLIDLFQLESYTEKFEIFKEEVKYVTKQVATKEGEISSVASWLSKNNLTDTTLLTPLEEPISSDEDEKALRSLMVEISNISQKNKIISKNNKYKELMDAIDVTQFKKVNLTKESTEDLEKELADCRAELRIHDRDIKANKDAPNKCPSCGGALDNSKSKKILEEAEDQKAACVATTATLSPELTRIKSDNVRKDKISRLIGEWEDLYKLYDSTIEIELIVEDDLIKQADLYKKSITINKKQAALTKKENIMIAAHNSKVELILEQKSDHEADHEAKKADLKILVSELSNLEVLKKTFSTNGLVAYKIENLVKELEDLTNQYLSDLSDGRFMIEFVITKDKLDVMISDNSNIVPISALSSGELARVNTATLIAIRKLMSSISKSKINVLFLDEVISTLDEEGKEKLVEVLLKENELNTFVVSHGWTHPLLDKVEVVKENNISRLE